LYLAQNPYPGPRPTPGPNWAASRTITPRSSGVMPSPGIILLWSDRPKRRTVALRASVSSDRRAQRGCRSPPALPGRKAEITI